MTTEFIILAAAIFFAAVAVLVLVFGWRSIRQEGRRILEQARVDATKVVEDAQRQGEAQMREAEVAAREKLLQARSEFEKISRKQRSELEAQERRLLQKQDGLDKKGEDLARRDKDLTQLDRSLATREKAAEKREAELERMFEEERGKLEQIAGLTAQQAREELVRVMEDEAKIEAAHIVKRIEDEAREQAGRAGPAHHRHGHPAARPRTTCRRPRSRSSSCPSDEMKGRIIGREGRNIRALETATGVDLIIDDTPEAVILSGFDPFRREVARVALERLIVDGRIHPARIEEVVEKVGAELEQKIRQEGEGGAPGAGHPRPAPGAGEAARPAALPHLLRPERAPALARRSPGWPAPWPPSCAPTWPVARRGGLLHDIGKAIDREMDGTHLQLGIDLLRKYGESEEVIHAMACHHGDYEPQTVEAVLVNAADALSAARPGARREVLETYVKRLEKLEEIASSFKGVQKTFAIQAGREMRIIVDSGKIADERGALAVAATSPRRSRPS